MVEDMRRIIYIIGIVTALSSCGLSETGGSQRPDGEDIWKNPAYNADSSSTARKRCYITALDYPDDYDWRADAENGTVKCSLVVFADGRPVMKVPVGHEYCISPDPDMHRVIKGHLYTDYSTEEETVIKKDGQELFRYNGREMIVGMAVKDEDIYTLGQARQGDGFSYRKNGDIIMERQKGRVFPRLQDIDDSLYFAFSETIESVSGEIERYYHAKNGTATQTAVREDVKKVWDIILHEGRSCYLATMTGISSPVAVNGDKMKALEFSTGINMLTSHLLSAGKTLGVEAICSSGNSYSSCLWKDAVKHKQFSNGMTTAGICSSGDGICCVLNSGTSGKAGQIFRCGESFDIPAGYAAMGNNPIAMVEGILYVGLSSLQGGKPLVWKDGKMEEIDINGCICTLSVN